MLTIRCAQMAALTSAAEREYEDFACDYVRAEYPDQFAARGEEGVRALVRRCLSRAKGYGMERDVDVTGLVSLDILLGDDFELQSENAWAHDILTSAFVAPEEKVALVLDGIVDGD